MEEIKNSIAESILKVIDTKISKQEIFDKIEIPKDKQNGDFSYPCFNLAKVLKNSPVKIADSIKEKIVLNDNISKVEVVNGYLNFYLNSSNISSDILKNIIDKKENFGSSDEGKDKNIVIDYSSPNIAKPFHLGHLRNTVIGQSLYNLYKTLGYNIIGINHLGDWGRQFGLLIEGYRRFKDEYEIEKDPISVLSDIYVRMNKLAKEDEGIFEIARENFKKLEDGDVEYIKTWEYFKEVSLKEYSRIYEILGCKFDSYNGEAFYNDKMDEVVKILDEKGVLVESEGAKVVQIKENEPPCIILKSNGSTIYATRDLAAILYRARTYDFNKALYVTGYEQIHHFEQVFEVAKYLVDEKYSSNLIHVPYGLVRLKTGKMSTRDGNVIYTQDLINDAIHKSIKIIEEKNSEIEDVEKLARQIGVGALIFNNLKQNKIKDIIFDLDEVLRFDGETGPYAQYTFVRTLSILNKAGFNIDTLNKENVAFDLLTSEYEIELIKALDSFSDLVKRAAESYEPAILTRYIIEISTLFSRFYNECPVLVVEDEKLKEARLSIVYATSIVLKKGLSILGIECPEKM
jgi:arginyl-tRNA synthetase